MDGIGQRFESMRAGKAITEADVLALRKRFYDDGAIGPDEAEAILELNRICTETAPGWTAFFVEALTDFTVHQALPQGYVTAENADWLIDRISEDGVVPTAAELELLVKVMEEARWVPARLSAFALEQVRHGIVEGRGALRHSDGITPCAVDRPCVDLIRRILYAMGGDSAIAVTREEAAVLFDINDATAEADNDPSWSDLFVKAVTNHLMAAVGYRVPDRHEALRLEQWVQEEPKGVADFFGRMLSGGLQSVWGSYTDQGWEERALARLEQQRLEIITSEHITEPEAEWLAERIGRDGQLHENERALLGFLKQQSPHIHPALEPLIEKAAA